MEVSSPKAARRFSWFAAVAVALPLAACAVGGNQGNQATNAVASAPEVHSSLKPNPDFAKLPQYAGTLGKRKIVMRLGAKTDPDDAGGVHGEYQFSDTGEVILIAGDRSGATLEAEESNDGTRITGNWVGTFAADGSISGDRMEVDDSNPVPFELKPMAAGALAAPAPTPKSGNAVGGVGNVVTGD
ncbi:hypothetical protein F4827_001604 [Paraburkholderia bannensis]|uniref:Lipoprotein n=1 Tax=Paraburkholderia bannensis TaxID=765414 RepID=A0A7W9TWZ7_9BURK|nr:MULTISPECIES: hypothetical protein [Paraburkholderia]MBB3256771.1 hypothetical protein [Paraburkholderia sp. WP4_3_2]MBB6101770.1 hypothetical protein [Paraburkholderia bannensis]